MILTRTHWRLQARLSAYVLITAFVAFGCDGSRSLRPDDPGDPGDPGESVAPPARLVLEPAEVTIQAGDSVDFRAHGLTAIGDTATVEIAWSATSGSIKGQGKGNAHGRYKGDTPGKHEVVATDSTGVADTATVTVIDQGSSTLLSNLSPSQYDTARLAAGDPYYLDRAFTLGALPSGLEGRLWIRTANDDKGATAESFLTFQLLEDAVVAVAYDKRATALPNWLRDWTPASTAIEVSDAAASPLNVFYREYPAGSVVLGGNSAQGAAGAHSMYVVLLLRPSELGPAALAISPAGAELDPGESVQFGATVTDPLGRPAGGTASIEWSATGGTITQQGLFTAGQTPGSYRITATATGTGLTQTAAVTVRDQGTADTTPPVISDGQPSGTLPAGTTETTISVATNEAATCKWGTSASTAYADLPNTFTTTGGTAHAATLTGLADGQSYTYHMRCQDAAGNANSASYAIGFSVASPGDTTPPVISGGQPTGTLPAGTTETTMSVTTNEAATCKWGTSSSTAYATLANTFTTTGGTSHSTTLSGLADGQSYTRYVRCQDAAGNANTSSYTISFSVASPGDTSPPVISDGQPSGTLPAGTIETTMSVTTNEAATCKWGTSASTAYADLANTFTTTGGTSHATILTGLADGQSYTRYVGCQDTAGNANASSYAISFNVASGGGGSTRITGITIEPSSLNRFSNGGDIWPITWADDGRLYTVGGDGNGWDGVDTRGLDVSALAADLAPNGNLANKGTEVFNKRDVLPRGIVSIGGILYNVETQRGGDFGAMRIGKSTNHGVTWSYLVNPTSGWTYDEPNEAFASVAFVQYGQDYANARDGFVYAVGEREGGILNSNIDMFRAPVSDPRDRSQHEYFAGLDPNGNATWASNLSSRAAILTRAGEIHWGPTVCYNPVLKRYLLSFFTDNVGTLAIYEGPEPWGPWTKIHEGQLIDATQKHAIYFVNKPGWISADGLTWWFVTSGTGSWDSFNVLKATLTVR